MEDRAQYDEETKWWIRHKYRYCRNTADKIRLVNEYEIGSLQKLYNLSSRLNATRPHANTHRDLTGEQAELYEPHLDFDRLSLREDPDKVEWTKDDDRVIKEHFGKYTLIEDLAFFLDHTESAVAYRARHLGLRNVPHYYDADKVCRWLGLSFSELHRFGKARGLNIHPCTDGAGELQIHLVSTISLARFLLLDKLHLNLIEKRGADKFFIRDIIESVVAVQDEEACWEPNVWVSHGHTSLNPFSENTFGLFYNGYDEKMVGADLDPADLAPSANVASDHWRRGAQAPITKPEAIKSLDTSPARIPAAV